MKYKIDNAIEVLSRTPIVIEILLSELSDNWIYCDEAPDTSSPLHGKAVQK